MFFLAILTSFFLYHENSTNTKSQVDTINEIYLMKQRLNVKNKYNEDITVIPMIIFIILKSSANGVIGLSVIFILFRLSKSSFDQAFRNQKRYDSTLFLSYIFEEYKEKIKENNISINDMMEAFEKWNKTVESAFSSSNFSIEQTPDLIGKSIDAIGTHTKNK